MAIFDFVRGHMLAWPTLAKSAIVLAVIVGVPPLSQRLRIPSVVGLLLAGVAIGPHGLRLYAASAKKTAPATHRDRQLSVTQTPDPVPSDSSIRLCSAYLCVG